MDVYAVWQRAELPQLGTDMSEMNTAQLYSVFTSGNADNYFEAKDYTDISAGKDFDFSNVESSMLIEDPMWFDGNTVKHTGIKLFDENERSFTLAIDFEFMSSTAKNTLVSCFDESGSEGFRLCYNSYPTLQWGDKSARAAFAYDRGMLVLRHVKGSNRLFVYTSANMENRWKIADAITTYELVRSRATSTDLELIFGAVGFTDGSYDDYGIGTIHWAKIWYDDLGEENAKSLAAWYHETWRMHYVDSGRYRLAGNTSQKCNGSFVLNQCLRFHSMNAEDSNVGGWDASAMRTFLNDVILKALPIEWRTIIKTVKIQASEGNTSAAITTSEDKIYLPSELEYGGNSSVPYSNEGSQYPIYTASTDRIKFYGMILEDTAQFYTSDSDPTLLSSVTVNEGDVWINTTVNNMAYMYVSPENAGHHSRYVKINASDGGEWVRAQWYWNRSPYVGNATDFFCSSPAGYIYGSSVASYYHGVTFGFSV